MNSDEYHAQDKDTNPNRCKYCDLAWGEHEHACPHNPDQRDNLTYQHLKEPWEDTP